MNRVNQNWLTLIGKGLLWLGAAALVVFAFKDAFLSGWLLLGNFLLAILSILFVGLAILSIRKYCSTVKQHAEYFHLLDEFELKVEAGRPLNDRNGQQTPGLPNRAFWSVLTILLSLVSAGSAVVSLDCFLRANDRTWCDQAVDLLIHETPNVTELAAADTYHRIASNPLQSCVWLGPVTETDISSDQFRMQEALKLEITNSLRCEANINTEWYSNDLLNGVQLRSVFTVVDHLRKSLSDGKEAIPPNRFLELSIVFARNNPDYLKKVAGEPNQQANNGTNAQKKLFTLQPAHFDGIRVHLLEKNEWLFILDVVRAVYCGWANLLILAAAVIGTIAMYLAHLRLVIEDRTQADTTKLQDRNMKRPYPGCKWKDFWLDHALAAHVADEWLSYRVDRQEASTSTITLVRLFKWMSMARERGLNPKSEEFRLYLENQGEQIEKDLLKLSPSNSGLCGRIPEFMTELGFLGTIVGILVGMSSAALTQVPSEDALYRSSAVGRMMSSLSVSFTTTLLGLLSAIFYRALQNRFVEIEEACISETVQNCLRRIVSSRVAVFNLLSPVPQTNNLHTTQQEMEPRPYE